MVRMPQEDGGVTRKRTVFSPDVYLLEESINNCMCVYRSAFWIPEQVFNKNTNNNMQCKKRGKILYSVQFGQDVNSDSPYNNTDSAAC